MTATLGLVNIHHLTVTYIFPVMKAFKIYTLSNFIINLNGLWLELQVCKNRCSSPSASA